MPIMMELEVRHPQGHADIFVPVVICDVCGERIDLLSQCQFVHEMREEFPEGWKQETWRTPVYFLHISPKPCMRLWDARRERQRKASGKDGFPSGFDTLQRFIWWLGNNLGAPWQKVIKDEWASEEDCRKRKRVIDKKEHAPK